MNSDLSKRDNLINTDKEYVDEIKESLDDITHLANHYYLSLPEDVVLRIINSYSDKVLIKILHELSKSSPEDLERFTKNLEKLVNSKNIKEIVESLALSGLIPKQYLTDDIKKLLLKEVFKNDPKDIILLNEVEISFEIKALRYKVQQLLVKHLPQNIHSKYDLTFHDLTITPVEEELIERQKSVIATPALFDDYIIEFKLGVERQYESEEMVYLGKKVIYYAKQEDKVVPDEVTNELDKVLKDTESFKHLGYDITKDSQDTFTFHQIRLMGSNYNFGVFGSLRQDSEFHEFPKLDKDKPIFILLHGLTQSWACWRDMINVLTDTYQVIVPDMNGFGDSTELVLFHNLDNYASYISNFLKHLGIEEYDLAGHSAGGFTVQQILDSPTLTPKHAIMLSSSAGVELSFIAFALLSFLKTASLENFIIDKIVKKGLLLKERITNLFRKDASSDLIKRYAKTSPRTIAELGTTLLTEYTIRGKKIKTSSKCLVVYGSKDFVILPKNSKELKDIFKNVQFIEIPDVGHSDTLVALPTKYKKELFEFLNS